jgi:CRP-like cAMP-binding protein
VIRLKSLLAFDKCGLDGNCISLSELLSITSIFSDLCISAKESVINSAIPRNFVKDEFITHYRDVWPYLFIVESGNITAIKESVEGRSLIVARFGIGDIFWSLAFFLDDIPTPAALVAGEDSRIHIWSGEQLLPILLASGRMSWKLLKLMVMQLILTSDTIEGLAFQPVAGRLARLLVERFGKDEVSRVSRDLTLDEMATHIGTTREVVCRMLHKFSDQGLIDITRTEFVFTNKNGLNQLAQKNGN